MPWPNDLAIWYFAASAITFAAYAADKSAARRGAWRSPESALHLLSLADGWPGASIAQRTLRHKSSKASFQLVYWTTVVVNCAAFAWVWSR